MKTNIPEEEKANSIVSDIEKIFTNFYGFLKNAASAFGSMIGTLLSAWKKLLLWGLIGGIIGAASLLIVPRKYESSITLKTYIDAKDQLNSDVESINAAITARNYERLGEILGLNEEEAKTISSIEINPTETFAERLSRLNKVLGELDSTLKKNLDVKDLLEDEKSSLNNKFRITIYATEPLVFEGIEVNLIEFLERVPELNRLRKNQMQIIQMQKDSYQKEIQNLDSLKQILNKVMLAQAKAKEGSEMTINMGKSGESDLINPLKVYDQVNNYVERIALLNSQIPHFEKCYYIVSHLNANGKKSAYGGLTRAIIGALAMGFIGMLSVLSASTKKQ